mmetsp:Transcript_77846/g.251811  ORF Transcript_77846/g.251811 Transcript_77846/m.251811 type:complete len:101 (-) Transcript_77846:115-417(-)
MRTKKTQKKKDPRRQILFSEQIVIIVWIMMTIDINVAFHEQGMAELESLDLNLAGGRRPGLIPELGKLVEGRVLEVLPALKQMHRRCAGWQSSGGIGNLE